MLRDILRFNREAPALLDRPDSSLTLNDYLQGNEYSREFIDHYIVPMGAAIWSASPDGMGGVPAGFFVRFFHNHGLLRVSDRPAWRVTRRSRCWQTQVHRSERCWAPLATSTMKRCCTPMPL
jgi:predicted NAD/FAD-binding protein